MVVVASAILYLNLRLLCQADPSYTSPQALLRLCSCPVFLACHSHWAGNLGIDALVLSPLCHIPTCNVAPRLLLQAALSLYFLLL